MIATKCHPNRINKGRGLCGMCYDKWLKSTNPGYRQRQIDNTSSWFKRNPEARRQSWLKRQAKEHANPLIRRAAHLKNKYGLTLQDYQNILVAQKSSCALCFRQQGEFPLHVDHNHETGKVRGLLCHQCNWYLGIIESDVDILNRIQSYLRIK